eukprot:scaffold6420_cov168-Amphora_coffeaeformis.AAC.23
MMTVFTAVLRIRRTSLSSRPEEGTIPVANRSVLYKTTESMEIHCTLSQSRSIMFTLVSRLTSHFFLNPLHHAEPSQLLMVFLLGVATSSSVKANAILLAAIDTPTFDTFG